MLRFPATPAPPHPATAPQREGKRVQWGHPAGSHSLSAERLPLPLPGDLHFIGLPLDLTCVEGAAACSEGGRCGLAGRGAGAGEEPCTEVQRGEHTVAALVQEGFRGKSRCLWHGEVSLVQKLRTNIPSVERPGLEKGGLPGLDGKSVSEPTLYTAGSVAAGMGGESGGERSTCAALCSLSHV